jgi:hypothetical protein
MEVKMTFNISDSDAELVDIRYLTDRMHIYTYAHVSILKSWLQEQGVNIVTLGSKSNKLVLVSPKDFAWAISCLAKRQELDARLKASEVGNG